MGAPLHQYIVESDPANPSLEPLELWGNHLYLIVIREGRMEIEITIVHM